MKYRQLFIVVGLTAGMPFSVVGSQIAGAALPFAAAAAVSAVLCGATAYFLGRAVWKLVQS